MKLDSLAERVQHCVKSTFNGKRIVIFSAKVCPFDSSTYFRFRHNFANFYSILTLFLRIKDMNVLSASPNLENGENEGENRKRKF